MLNPKFTITNRMTAAITQIERARGFLEAAHLSDEWVRDMGDRALVLEAHHTTHIEGTHLTLDQAERLWNGRASRLLSTLCLYKGGYDFKRLFTISEYYDRDRISFYKSIQSVRENGMDMTGWLDYFVTGLETQMIEVKQRGEKVIRRDVLVQKHSLNDRQSKALDHLMQHERLTVKDYEALCPEVNRRSLQRDIKNLLDKELIKEIGVSATDPNRYYELKKL
jgi:Fic family protein